MFANLKNKLIEEVKASKFQQFAQAAVSSSTTSSVSGNENFFSITEEDTPQNSPSAKVKPSSSASSPQSALNNGGELRTRRLSNSSMASDISFRLPTYDSPAIYHLQSDLDMSASEETSPASKVKLDVIDKEQLYEAYKKILDRYHRSRSRYTDLAHKYKDLERDSTKARSVLLETQEKAIRRISELREQCTLEQQAKAHLEEALRMEMDDMECKMRAYKTKLKLLGENPENVSLTIAHDDDNDNEDYLIELNESKTAESVPENKNLINLVDTEISNDVTNINTLQSKNIQLERLLEKQKNEIDELNKKLQKSNESFNILKMQEEENAYQLAQTKQAIYTELENKESEVQRLGTSLKKVEQQYQESIKELKNISIKNSELSEKQEKMRETEAKLIASDHLLSEIKQKLSVKEKSLADFENRMQMVKKEHEQKIIDLQRQNEELSQMMQRYQKNEISLAEIDNELNRTKTENDGLNAIITENQQQIQLLENRIKADQHKIESNETEREEMKKKLNDTEACIEKLTKKIIDMENLNKSKEIQLLQLESEQNESMASNLSNAKKFNETLEKLSQTENQLEVTLEKLDQLQKDYEIQENMSQEQRNEIEALRQTVEECEKSLSTMQSQNDKTQSEKTALQSQTTQILEEISKMETQLKIVQKSHADLEQEKKNLELKMDMTKQDQYDDDSWQQQQQLIAIETKLKQVEQKLHLVESENSQLSEKNCLLEENSNRLAKLIAEKQNHETEQNKKYSTEIGELSEKMSQILDENSQLHNAKEILDHELRSLQDKCESIEKEKLCLLDSNECLKNKIENLTTKMASIEKENQNLTEILNKEKENVNQVMNNMKLLADQNESSENLITSLRNKLAESNEVNLQQTQELLDLEAKYQLELSTTEDLNKKLALTTTTIDELEAKKIILKENEASLCNELEICKQSLEKKTILVDEMSLKLESFELMGLELERCKEKLIFLKEKNESLQNESIQDKTALSNTQTKVVTLLKELEDVRIQNSELLQELSEKIKNISSLEEKLDEKIKASNNYEQSISELKDQLQSLLIEKKNTHSNSDEMQIENEYLNTLTKQLEVDLFKQKEQISFKTDELKQLNDKLKSNESTLDEQKRHCDETQSEMHRQREENVKEMEILKKRLADSENIIDSLKTQLEKVQQTSSSQSENSMEKTKSDNLRKINEQLQHELEELKHKSTVEISNLTQEIDDLTINARHMMDKIAEYEKGNTIASSAVPSDSSQVHAERDALDMKMKTIMDEVQDVSNRNLFLEQKCENYSIIEQSNERLKLQNAKLSRQLDETLVSMQHNESITGNTEFEYLKNIMLQYLTGTTSASNETLVKVISAVLRFSPQQTHIALEKEHQRRSLLNKIL